MRVELLSCILVQLLLISTTNVVGIPRSKDRLALRREYGKIVATHRFIPSSTNNETQILVSKEPLSERIYSNLRVALMSIRKQFDEVIVIIQDRLYNLLTNVISYFAPTISIVKDYEEQCVAEGHVGWAGVTATAYEKQSILFIRKLIVERIVENPTIKWYSKVKDTEILRFLRAQQGDVQATWKMITEHVAWRSSTYGADSPLAKHNFLNSPLHHEVFWAGVNRVQCPTLVIRTQAHNATYYDHDLQVYESFIISQIEKGRKLYGVGTRHQMCVLLDRGGQVLVNGQAKSEAADMAIVPRIVELAASLRNTLQANYPDILHSAKIAPSSWFFTLCYRMVSATLDAATLGKFEIIRDFEIPDKLHTFIDPALLPAHLGGSSSSYTSAVHIEFRK